jgi:glycine betaine/proline transport system permease protein
MSLDFGVAALARGRRVSPTMLALLGVAALAAFCLTGPNWLWHVPDWALLPVAAKLDRVLNWFAKEAMIGGLPVQQITRFASALMEAPIHWTTVVLAEGIEGGRGLNKTRVVPPLSWISISGLTMLIALRVGGLRLALGAGLGLAYLVVFGLWKEAMITLASVLVSVVIALAIGLALGIRSFRNPRFEGLIRGLMNVMQTVPTYAYLVPTLLLFGYGPSAALIATVAYALPPMVHNTVIALRSLPPQTVEAGIMSGCTRRQLMWQVMLPAALPRLALGLNQVVMMTLNMVIIASMIGAGGLGYNVLVALRKLDIGSGLEAGLGIVALAVIMDRIGQATADWAARGKRPWKARPLWHYMIGFLVLSTISAALVPPLQDWPEAWRISTALFWNGLITWITTTFFDQIEAFRALLLLNVMRPTEAFLIAIPWALVLGIVFATGLVLGGLRLGLQVLMLGLFIAVTGFWIPAMESLYLLIFSVIIALGLGMPLGFWIGLRPGLMGAANLVLDTAQTIPTFIYLLPAVMLFRIGDVSAVIAIASYAFAAAVRYAAEGIAKVPHELTEAASMSGCSAWQTFIWVQVPSARSTLILGVNQAIMMAFSMLVIAALVGTRDLGQQVLAALNRSLVGQGVVAGLAVAAMALIADLLLKAAAATRHKE